MKLALLDQCLSHAIQRGHLLIVHGTDVVVDGGEDVFDALPTGFRLDFELLEFGAGFGLLDATKFFTCPLHITVRCFSCGTCLSWPSFFAKTVMLLYCV